MGFVQFGRQSYSEGESSSICWSTPRRWPQKLGAASELLSRGQALGPPFAVFSDALAWSWIRSAAARK